MRFSPRQLNLESSEPLYIQVFYVLRQAVSETAPDSGMVLPSSTELAQQFKGPPNTVRSAMGMLVDRDWSAGSGIGTPSRFPAYGRKINRWTTVPSDWCFPCPAIISGSRF